MKTKVNQEIKKEFLEKLGRNVRKIRKTQKLSQIDLAEKCTSDIAKISKTELGKYDFRISSLLIIANGLNVTLAELLSFPEIDFLVKNIIIQVPDY